MNDSEDEFTQDSLNRNTGSQFLDSSAFLENRNNLDITLNDHEGLHVATWRHVVEAAGDQANNGATDDGADPAAGEPVYVPGSDHAPDTIGAAAPPPPKDAHIRVDPKTLVGFKQIKHEKMLYGGYR